MCVHTCTSSWERARPWFWPHTMAWPMARGPLSYSPTAPPAPPPSHAHLSAPASRAGLCWSRKLAPLPGGPVPAAVEGPSLRGPWQQRPRGQPPREGGTCAAGGGGSGCRTPGPSPAFAQAPPALGLPTNPRLCVPSFAHGAREKRAFPAAVLGEQVGCEVAIAPTSTFSCWEADRAAVNRNGPPASPPAARAARDANNRPAGKEA